ncbi:hypothetical protein BKH43_07610 [Helicobacter sp. 13S00401-1]|uniref:hypothetical protein n=1 Tax=Helicobacter sp. 13S00401-1 TaxID=1905758 RepID=UPI000BA7A00D|nr:hypothetical protein [Helicobacter sp. 13S00401-1]PAF49002.1 hypothetical protein BKH43_07610 [Helicobacter sp. 13S00401-1]
MIFLVFFIAVMTIGWTLKLLAFFVNGGGEKIANGYNSFEKSLDDKIKARKEELRKPIDKNAPLQWKDFNNVGTRTGRLALRSAQCFCAFVVSIPVIITLIRYFLGLN